MKDIKLTPLIMFILLVAVLIVSMFIGYSMKEGVTTMVNTAPTQVYAPYDSRPLVVIKNSTSTYGAILFDPKYGNIVNIVTDGSGTIGQDATAGFPFIVVRRDGKSTTYTPVNGVSSEWVTAKAQMQTIGQMTNTNTQPSSNYAWSYNYFDMTIINVTWDTKTVIYLLSNSLNRIEDVYISTYLADASQITMQDDTIINMPLPTATSGIVTASSQNRTRVDGVMAYQISENVYYSFDGGILVKTGDGYNIAHDSHATTGSVTEFDNRNNTAIIATKFVETSTPSAVVVIISAINNTHDGAVGKVAYQLTTTARVSDSQNSHSSGGGSGRSGGGSRTGGLVPVSKRICRSGYEIAGTYNPETGQPYCHRGKYPSSNDDGGDGSDCEYDSPYILKTEIVPPVCPMCPTSGSNQSGGGSAPSAPSACNVTVNTSGQFVDCNGNIITPYTGSSPSSFGSNLASGFNTTVQTAGRTIDSTVQSASNLLGNTVGTAGNVINTGVGTAGNVLNKGLGTVGGAVSDVTGGIEGTVTGLGKDVSNIVTGLGSDITSIANNTVGSATGLASQTVGSATGLASQAMGTAAGLAYDTGSGAYSLAQQAMNGNPYGSYYNQYGQPVGYQMQQPPVIYPGAPVYPSGMYQGFGTCGVPYYPQGPDPMPITNDFSQFT